MGYVRWSKWEAAYSQENYTDQFRHGRIWEGWLVVKAEIHWSVVEQLHDHKAWQGERLEY
jgi:hypothetical protein